MSLSSSFKSASVANPVFKKNTEPKTKPFCIRLTNEEKAILLQKAANEHLSTWARGELLGAKARKRHTSRKPKVDDKSLALIMALLGDQRIASNLNQLARHANLGTLDFDDHVLEQIQEACAAMIAVRNYLLDSK